MLRLLGIPKNIYIYNKWVYSYYLKRSINSGSLEKKITDFGRDTMMTWPHVHAHDGRTIKFLFLSPVRHQTHFTSFPFPKNFPQLIWVSRVCRKQKWWEYSTSSIRAVHFGPEIVDLSNWTATGQWHAQVACMLQPAFDPFLIKEFWHFAEQKNTPFFFLLPPPPFFFLPWYASPIGLDTLNTAVNGC